MTYQNLDFLPFLHPTGFLFPAILLLVVVWSLIIKGIALWRSARNSQKAWFIILLIVNTLGILELVYLIWFAKDSKESTTAAPAPAPAPVSSTPGA